jgi:DNA-binding winged helix-turn-helix (wHTH) protein
VTEVALSRGVVRFATFEVDLANAEVRKHGFRIRLQGQPFRVLQILLEHPGELVTREELQRQIWPADTFVDFEKGLNKRCQEVARCTGRFGRAAPNHRDTCKTRLSLHRSSRNASLRDAWID